MDKEGQKERRVALAVSLKQRVKRIFRFSAVFHFSPISFFSNSEMFISFMNSFGKSTDVLANLALLSRFKNGAFLFCSREYSSSLYLMS